MRQPGVPGSKATRRAPPARPFLVCVHDASPAFARETRRIIRELEPLVGHSLAFGVVPDWDGAWPLGAHTDYCRLVEANAGEVLLHGYHHRRGRGWGPATWLAEGSDEMPGLDRAATVRTLERAQRVLTEVFGEPARGFLPPAWQAGQVRRIDGNAMGLEYVLGFASLAPWSGADVPLATWSWDCGRWGWPGHVGHALGRMLHSLGRRVPSLVIHPRDLERGFWPRILRLVEELRGAGYEPVTPAGLLHGRLC